MCKGEKSMLKMGSKILIASIVASLLLPILVNPTFAITPTYKDYKPSTSLVIDWGFGIGSITLLPTHSEVQNLVVRAYSDKEIVIWGDITADWGALLTTVDVELLTAYSANVEITSFTWSNVLKWAAPRTQFTVGADIWGTMPGAKFFACGPGNGHFEMKISNINPDVGAFAILVAVGNAGSGLALVMDIYDVIGITTKLPEKILWGLLTLIGAGSNVPSLIATPPVYLAADLFPTTSGTVTSGPPPAGGFEIERPLAVYYDERYPTSWISRSEATAFRNYLAERGFVVLNADDLKTFMQNAGKYSVVVMAQDVVPDTVGDVESSSAIIRQYLDRGGRVVWMEDVPFYYQGHADGTSTNWGTNGEHNIIGVGEGTWDLSKTVQIKSEGVNRGLTQTWQTVRESDDGTVNYILADEDSSDAAGYIKCFNNGGEFIRIWDNEGDFTSSAYLKDLTTVATTGSLSWQVDMTAYNADATYARCADMYINGYWTRPITWLNARQTVTGTTKLPGYWFTHQRNAIDAWVTSYDQYDYGNSWVAVTLTSPEGFVVQYCKMKPANEDHRAYFEYFMTGLWHVDNYRYHSTPVSIAYNSPTTHDYNTGKRTSGVFTFTLDLRLYGASSKITMEFWHLLWKENSGSEDYDKCMVQVSKNYGDTWTTLIHWDGNDPDITSWTSVSLDLTSFTGYNLQIRFLFDSVDQFLNDYEGWYIDDISVYLTQNDAGTGGDAGNDFNGATTIYPPNSYYGALYEVNPTDREDWYKFYASSGQTIYLYMSPPSGVDFDLQLYDPYGNCKTGSYNGRGSSDSLYFTATSSGYWRARIYIFDGEGQYYLYAYAYWPGGGGGCPILYVWKGKDYACEGLLNIHNPEGVDVIYNHTLVSTPKRVHGVYLFRLTEHPQTHSYIDQVKLYAILEDKTVIELPLIWAWHLEDGNVLPQLLFSDEWKTDTLGADLNNGISQSIDLKFAALSPSMKIIGFVFQIEGNNMVFKV
jgi:hypothetical protein